MYKTILVLTTILLVSVGVVFSQSKRDTRDVVDYFKLVPATQDYDFGNILTKNGTKVEVKDTKNGYLKITGAFEGWMEVALFRKKDRSPILIVGQTHCSAICSTDLFAFEYKNGKMVAEDEIIDPSIDEHEITAKYQRNENDSDKELFGYIYELPRNGTTVKLLESETNTLIFELLWKNDKFILDRSVLDYYHLFPRNELNPENERKATILIHDKNNGYLKMKVPGSTIEVALFRKTNGSAILLYAENYCGRPRCVTAEITAQEYIDNDWIDITDKIIPDQEELEGRIHRKSSYANKYGYQFKIPRLGTTVNIVEGEDGKTIYKLVWKDNKFVVQ